MRRDARPPPLLLLLCHRRPNHAAQLWATHEVEGVRLAVDVPEEAAEDVDGCVGVSVPLRQV